MESSNEANAIHISDDYVRIEGLQLLAYNANGRDGVKVDNQGCKISYCIIKGQANSYVGIRIRAGNGYIWNNIIYDFNEVTQPGNGISSNVSSGNVYVYNNTIVNCNRGLVTGYGDTKAINNIVYSCVDSYYDDFANGSDYNATDRDEDMSVVGGGGINNKKNQIFVFTNFTINNFHLASSDTSARDVGINLASDVYLSFSDDIDGVTRGNVWDIGADEYGPKPKYKIKSGGDGGIKMRGYIKFR